MNRTRSTIIIGGAISAAAIAVAIDHTRQRLPVPEKQLASQAVMIIDEGDEMPVDNEGDCANPAKPGRQASPCSL